MAYQLPLSHGDQVIVLDRCGIREARGFIVGRRDTWRGPIYDVQPMEEYSLRERLCDIPEARLRATGRPVLASGGNRARPEEPAQSVEPAAEEHDDGIGCYRGMVIAIPVCLVFWWLILR